MRRVFGVVGRQVGQQLLNQRDGVMIVLGNEVRVAAHRSVHFGTADFGHRRGPTSHRLDHFRAGKEHVRVMPSHDHEIHQRR